MIVALDPPDFRTISDFRKRPFEGARRVVPTGTEVVRDSRAGQTRPRRLDGTKIKANASKHKAMSYERMKKREAELKAEVAGMLAAAEAADVQEDEISARTSVVTRCRTGPAIRRNGWRRSRRRWRRWRPRPSWPRRKSAASRPKNNSSATLKAARSRANRRHHYRTNLIPRRNATSPIRTGAS